MAQHRIPDCNLAGLKDEIERLNRRAQKLGVQPVAMRVIGQETEEENGAVYLYHLVEVTGEAPRLNGWTFVGTLQFVEAEVIVRAVPGQSIPERFRTAEKWCDHCCQYRTRKDTYIVRNGVTGEYKQVGSTCLRDFLGHASPDAVADWASILAELDETAESFGGSESGNWYTRFVSVPQYLGWVAASIRRSGWISRGAAREAAEWGTSKVATADDALWCMENQAHSTVVAPVEADRELAAAALKWAREELAVQAELNDYQHNLVVAVSKDHADRSLLGFVGSLIPAYSKEMGRRAEAAAAGRPSEYVGKVKDKLTLSGLKCTAVIPFEGEWGMTYITKFADEQGNVFVWYTGSVRLEPGTVYSGKGVVKEHSEYRGTKQTTLTRCKLEEVEAVAA